VWEKGGGVRVERKSRWKEKCGDLPQDASELSVLDRWCAGRVTYLKDLETFSVLVVGFSELQEVMK
jgi:hypothetical protein